jgi:multimeric flavodoxin WrbA
MTMMLRRAGATRAFDALNHFFLISEMIVTGSSYWNIGIGREAGDCEEGLRGDGDDAGAGAKHGVAADEGGSVRETDFRC